MSILQPCPSRPLAICGLLFFEGFIDEGAQPGADVEVPLDDEALETLTGFGRDMDMKRYTVQHRDTQQHMERQAGYNATQRYMETHAATVSAKKCSMAFPPGITVEGATPERGGVVVDFGVHHLTLPGAAPAAKIPGSLPPLPPPPVRRHDARGEAGTRGAGAALRFAAEDSGNPCQPASNAGFRAQPGPQRRGLRPLREEHWSGQKREPLGAPPV